MLEVTFLSLLRECFAGRYCVINCVTNYNVIQCGLLFRGALNVRATTINNKMKIAAAKVIAKHAEENELVPSLLHPDVHKDVTAAVERAALESGVIKHWD